MAATGAQKDNRHVKIDMPEEEQKKCDEPKTPPPAPSQVTAPLVTSQLKDEVELLRAGEMNIHGQHFPKGTNPR